MKYERKKVPPEELLRKDAWHAMKGYRSGRDMNLIVHSKTHGEVLRARCDVGMIQ